jgi:cytochrome c peroxidase
MKLTQIKFYSLSLISALITIVACNKIPESKTNFSETPNLPTTPYDYLQIEESGIKKDLSSIINDQSTQTFNITNHTIALGRVLFYDRALSINNSVSCGTCHKQSLAFADNSEFSIGFANKLTTRNSMAILNSANNNNMFWDSRATSPFEMSLMPVFNHIEMGMESDEMLVNKLKNKTYYTELFNKAYNSSEITKEKISTAITHFVSSIFSKQSKFDKGQLNDFKDFSSVELLGKDLFFSSDLKCSECHSGNNFSAPDFPGGAYGFSSFGPGNDFGPRGTANIGLDMVYQDNGRGNGLFKIPSLRNIALTGPYMHDGRFKTLDEVLDHYSHGIKKHPNLDHKFLKNNKVKSLNLSESDKYALKMFLNTLTDFQLISDKKFSNPFLN